LKQASHFLSLASGEHSLVVLKLGFFLST